MKKTKLEKGITLVALIITIVVLLILAVVSIGAVKNSGIIGHATNTADMWTTAQTAENASLLKYENYLDKYENKIYEKEKEWKVYGTLESYVIMSSDGDIIMRTSEGITKAKLQKYSMEQYIQLAVDMAIKGDSTANADDIRKNIEMDLSQMEDTIGVTLDYIFFDINGDYEGGFYLGGGRCYIDLKNNEYLEPNEELAKKVIRKKGTFECYGAIETKQDETDDSNNKSRISDVIFSGMVYIVDENNWYGYFGNAEGKWNLTGEYYVRTNEEDFNVLLNGENYTIKKGVKKLIREEEKEYGWYIQDSQLLINAYNMRRC